MSKRFKTVVPISPTAFKTKKEIDYLIKFCKETDIYGIWLVRDLYANTLDERIEKTRILAETLKSSGIKVMGCWLSVFFAEGWFDKEGFDLTVDIDGKKLPAEISTICPLDDNFAKTLAQAITSHYRKTGIKDYLLDDDLRSQYVCNNAKCFCDKHMKLYAEMLGENLTREEWKRKLFIENEARYRKIWIDANNSSLEHFCKTLRTYIDEESEDINVGICVGPSVLYGENGKMPVKLAKILAGDHIPYVRLIGGPYWDLNDDKPWNMEIAELIDYERRQANYFRNDGIEIFSEGDSWPHFRWLTAASKVQNFDYAIRADGNFDGDQKYVFDYDYSPFEEGGYAESHKNNKDIYKFIDENFVGKNIGINPFKPFGEEYLYADIPFEQGKYDIERTLAPSRPTKLLNYHAIPTSFEKDMPMAVFGNNALFISEDDTKKGLVLDYVAARILTEKGFDVGLNEITPLTDRVFGVYEVGVASGKRAQMQLAGSYLLWTSPQVKNGAKILTEFNDNGRHLMGTYLYKNANGGKFAVLPYDMEISSIRSSAYTSYLIQSTLFDAYEYFTGTLLPLRCGNEPYVYTMLKQNKDGYALGIWNFSDDALYNFKIEVQNDYILDKTCAVNADFVSGAINIDFLPAKQFCAITVKKK